MLYHCTHYSVWCTHACSVTKWCLSLCDPVDGSPPDSLPMGFSRHKCWSRLPCPPPWDRPNPGTETVSLMSPALASRIFTTNRLGNPVPSTDYLLSKREYYYGGESYILFILFSHKALKSF